MECSGTDRCGQELNALLHIPMLPGSSPWASDLDVIFSGAFPYISQRGEYHRVRSSPLNTYHKLSSPYPSLNRLILHPFRWREKARKASARTL
jgi:hypothetical protein